VAFYRFPQPHWQLLRTTNPVESPFAAARLRTDAAKRFRVVKNATAIIWKMLLVAEQAFRRVKHPELMPAVYRGVTFVDGIEMTKEVAA
jgi:transposase-like protein